MVTLLNHITVMGRLTRDPELRRAGDGKAVANFTVACERDFGQNGQKETDYFDCVAWRQTGEFVSKYFRKGSMIVVSGRLQIRSWTDKDGNKRKSAEIVADNCYFGESKKSAESNGVTVSGGLPEAGGFPETMAYAEKARNMDFNIPYPGGGTEPYAMLDDDDGQLPF